ncbi:hypothetical protein PCC8801_3907 [Rippkaea orientalis PCC 8801]|uniref:Uncharacterized protein n=1 Tax=Rippkaea orientalis (strain PCC 8801 / RF-1) TaxID=41431 RepID=B7K529_RIPO1|nr:hypothetical protein [Rippkaea orientalis]ACK67855.1 hypothetical protein PCC8801_3907 [Rippkaea orientalis PCC 8801]
MLKNRVLGVLVTLSCLIAWSEVNAQDKANSNPCPSDLETLTALMLRDLPSYANRVIQRQRLRTPRKPPFTEPQRPDLSDRPSAPDLYIIVAGKAEFEPLPLTNLQYQTILPDTAQQVFFTTLERQYGGRSVVDLQNYYWLFLTPTEEGWRSMLLFSQLAALNKGDLPLPPQDASDGAIGQGIDLWLRDCRAGVIPLRETGKE